MRPGGLHTLHRLSCLSPVTEEEEDGQQEQEEEKVGDGPWLDTASAAGAPVTPPSCQSQDLGGGGGRGHEHVGRWSSHLETSDNLQKTSFQPSRYSRVIRPTRPGT